MGNFLDSIVETTTKNIHLETKEEIEYLKYYSKINKCIKQLAAYGHYEITFTFKSINDYPKGYCYIDDNNYIIRYSDTSLIEVIENYYLNEGFEVTKKDDLSTPTIKLTISWKEAVLEQIL